MLFFRICKYSLYGLFPYIFSDHFYIPDSPNDLLYCTLIFHLRDISYSRNTHHIYSHVFWKSLSLSSVFYMALTLFFHHLLFALLKLKSIALSISRSIWFSGTKSFMQSMWSCPCLSCLFLFLYITKQLNSWHLYYIINWAVCVVFCLQSECVIRSRYGALFLSYLIVSIS